jgi:hypothetical protein
MADLAVRLRCSCNCNIDTSPCGAEEECRLALEAADEIERLRAALEECSQPLLLADNEGVKYEELAGEAVRRMQLAGAALSPKRDSDE